MVSDCMLCSCWFEWMKLKSDLFCVYLFEFEEVFVEFICDLVDLLMDEFDCFFDWMVSECLDFFVFEIFIFGYGFSVMKFVYCVQCIYEEIVLECLCNVEQFDFLGFFLIVNDVMSYIFWYFYEVDEYDDVDL